MTRIQSRRHYTENQNLATSPSPLASQAPSACVKRDTLTVDSQLIEQIRTAVLHILQHDFRIACKRDKETEMRIVQSHKVELFLKSTIATSLAREWLQHVSFADSVYEIGTFRLVGKTHRPILFNGTRDLAIIASSLKQGAKAMEAYVEHVKNIKPATPIDPNASKPFVEIAGTLQFFAAELNHKTANIENTPLLHFGDIVDLSINGFLDCSQQQTFCRATCLELYMRVNGMANYEEAVVELQKILGIPTGTILDQPRLYNRGHWRQAKTSIHPTVPASSVCNSQWMSFDDRYGRFSYDVQISYGNDGAKVILPISAWTKRGQASSFLLHVPPEPPFPLFQQGMMRIFPQLPVILTDSMEMALALAQSQNSFSPTFVVSTWYHDGGIAAIDLIDWDPLHQGRDVHFLMANTSGDAPEIAKTMAAKIYDKLAAKGISVTIWDFTSRTDGSRNAGNLVHRDLLPVIDDAPTTTEPSREPQGKSLLRKPSDLKNAPPPQHLIEPIVEVGNCCMLYAAASAGKTFVTLKLACSLAAGSLVFGKWQAKKAGRCLYIGGEMTENSIGRRLDGIISQFDEQHQKSIDRNLQVAMLGGKRPNLATEDGQRLIEDMIDEIRRESDYREKVDMIFLDNMLCLVPGFSNVDVWNRFSTWLDSLKYRGIAVLLVNHAMKGDVETHFGPTAQIAAVDNSIRVKKLPSEKKNFLRLHISFTKGRDLDDDAKEAIDVQFSPNDYTQPWEVLTPHDDGRDLADQLQALMDEGLPNKDIAERLEMPKRTFMTRKKELGLTRPYGKKKAKSEPKEKKAPPRGKPIGTIKGKKTMTRVPAKAAGLVPASGHLTDETPGGRHPVATERRDPQREMMDIVQNDQATGQEV